MPVNDKWQPNQCGFMTKHSTEANIFVINSIYQTFVKNDSKNIFLVFVDFKIFFDCIIREHLLSKLLQNGIGGRFYQVIKNMYDGIKFKVKTSKGYTKEFISTSGVKQGCNLSPSLANIFQNDMPLIFDKWHV